MINGSVELDWADGTYTFNIAKFKEQFELEDLCGGVGIYEIHQRLVDLKPRLHDIREPIRLGLIGGGMTPVQAIVLVKRYVDDRPTAENIPVARTILMAAMIGVPGDEVGKKQEAEQTATEATPASSVPQSTDLEQPSGSPRAKSMKSRSGNSVRASKAGTKSTVASNSQRL